MTLAELIADTERALTAAGVGFGHGTTNAHDEAAWLVLHAVGLPLHTDFTDPKQNQALAPEQLAQAATLLRARTESRKPLAYLIGEAWLQGVPFTVDERAIVPRSLIAEVIADGSVDPWLGENTHRVLDLCTGNGSLAVLAAMAWPDVQVDAADLSPDALAVAALNVQRHALTDRIRLIESDGLARCSGPYDLILCNPPYVNAQSMAALPAEYLAEPELALAGGADGMDFVRQLVRELPERLGEDGVLVLEIGNERAYFDAAFPGLPVFWMPTSAGSDQVLLLTREALAHWMQEQPTQL